MKCTLPGLVVATLVFGAACSNAQAAAGLWEKIDNSNAAVFDQSTGTSIQIGTFGFSVPLVGDKSLPPIPGHMIVMPAAGESISVDIFYDGPAADFPANGSLDLHFQISPPSGLPASGISVGVLQATGSFPGSDFGASGLLIAQWAGTHHFAMSTGSKGFLTITSVTSTFDGVGSFFDIFTDLSLADGSSVDPTQPLFSVTLTSQSVPEPSSMVLASLGFMGLGAWTLRRARHLLKPRAARS